MRFAHSTGLRQNCGVDMVYLSLARPSAREVQAAVDESSVCVPSPAPRAQLSLTAPAVAASITLLRT